MHARYAAPAGDPLTQPLLDFLPAAPEAATEAPPAAAPVVQGVEPTWPCTACAARNPIAATVCGACGTAFLAQVSAETKVRLVLPVVGDLGAMSRGKRVGVALGFVAAVCVPVALLTLALTGSPPKDEPVTPAPVVSAQP